MFIVLEGPDKVGKSTQVPLLAAALEDKLEKEVVQTREPGGTELGLAIREIVCTNPQDVVTPALFHLYLADRAQHMVDVVRPALDAGKVVLCDRFDLSTIVYQSFIGGIPLDIAETMCWFARGGTNPNVCLEESGWAGIADFATLRKHYETASLRLGAGYEHFILDTTGDDEITTCGHLTDIALSFAPSP
jgi:hypothetical protein